MAKHLFIIGAQRSGTTYLYKMLDAHPEVYMAKPVVPEPKYFINPENNSTDYNAYFKKYFTDAGDVVWLGEKSTSYMECDEAAIAISRLIPSAAIIVMLRDPVERTISHYSFTRDNGLEPYDIERAIHEESLRKDNWRTSAKTSVNPYAYTERSKYAPYLEQWNNLFGKDRLIILVTEHFVGNQSAIAALYRRLGINPRFVPPGLTEKVNAGSPARTGCTLSEKFRSSLQEMFQPWNQILKINYGLDISCWEK